MSGFFVAYATQDERRIKDAVSMLQRRGFIMGIDITIGRFMEPEDDRHIAIVIQDLIKEASSVVIMWSEAAARAPHVSYEFGLAAAQDKPIFVVDLDRRHRLPPEMSKVKVIHFEDLT